MTNPAQPLEAILWDFGGVITSSPFEAFARFERARGLPEGFLRRVNAVDPDANAWARFERAEIDAAAFDQAFAEESARLGWRVGGGEILPLLMGAVRPGMVAALKACKTRYKVGCITNNTPGGVKTGELAAIFALFDHVLESARIGLRKPDPRIYALMCEALGVEARACVYLDDLGINLKPARAMGMATIKVESEAQALAELGALTGLDLTTG